MSDVSNTWAAGHQPLPRLPGEGVRTEGAPAGGVSGLSGHDGPCCVLAFAPD